MDSSGRLALTPHPAFLGSKLSHPLITTDFSEAQLELITPVNHSIHESLETLDRIHRFVYTGLEEELLWSSSMPCEIPADSDIPLARYGRSNLGRLKTTYRHGLGLRYGRAMQTICAIHYNFSFSSSFWEGLARLESSQEPERDYQSRRYFDLMRNFRRYSWLLVYLFGASPAVCKSFIAGRRHDLEEFDETSAYLPFATSLRNGDLGYQSGSQSDLLDICYNSLENYIESLRAAICTPHPVYASFTGRQGEEPPQVNGHILQSEAEFYTTIRAKRVPPPGENFLAVLATHGVQYLEVRLLDINPYLPLGINSEQIRFLDTFLLFCLLKESPVHDDALCRAVRQNIALTVKEGRKEDLCLDDRGHSRSLREWGLEILQEMQDVAKVLDGLSDSDACMSALAAQANKLREPGRTPSAMILSEMTEQQIPFSRFAMNRSREHRQYFRERPLTPEELAYFRRLSEVSIRDQHDIERSDSLSFSDYLRALQEEYENLA